MYINEINIVSIKLASKATLISLLIRINTNTHNIGSISFFLLVTVKK